MRTVEPAGDPQAPPVVQVLQGRPTDVELAAVVVVLAAGSTVAGAPARRGGAADRSAGTWADPAALVRRPLPSPWGAAAALPR